MLFSPIITVNYQPPIGLIIAKYAPCIITFKIDNPHSLPDS